MKRFLFCSLVLALAAGAAWAQPAEIQKEKAAASALEPTSMPAARACDAKPLFSSALDEAYVCGPCGDCHGEAPGTFCGIDEGGTKVCQDQLISCLGSQYPNNVHCRCTSGIVP